MPPAAQSVWVRRSWRRSSQIYKTNPICGAGYIVRLISEKRFGAAIVQNRAKKKNAFRRLPLVSAAGLTRIMKQNPIRPGPYPVLLTGVSGDPAGAG